MSSASGQFTIRSPRGPIALDGPQIMGIVNATPDSFSDAGQFEGVQARVERALELVEAGADVIDIGGQSGITGVPEVEASEEIDRVLPVVEGLRAASDVVISIDTYKPAVVAAVLAADADIINDVSGLLYPEIADSVRDKNASIVVMHNRGKPKVRLTVTDLYDDVVVDVLEFINEKVDYLLGVGVERDQIIVDPGPDFSKTPFQTIQVLRELQQLSDMGYPILLPLSRKDFIGALTHTKPRERHSGTLAALAACLRIDRRAIMRVHDVAEVKQFITVLETLEGHLDVADDLELPKELRREPKVQGKGKA